METHEDVSDEIREKLYTEEQQRLEQEKPKSVNILGTVPINNINVLPPVTPFWIGHNGFHGSC